MATAREFIQELRTREVLSEKHIVVIEQSLLQPAEEIPAADLANYLVEQLIISAAISNAILAHLHNVDRQTPPSTERKAPESRRQENDDDDIVRLKPISQPVPPSKAEKQPPAMPGRSTVPGPKTVPVPPPKTEKPPTDSETPVRVSPPKPPAPPVPPEPPEPKAPKGLTEQSEEELARVLPKPLWDATWRIEKRENPWDTPLVKYGIISLGLLLLASVVLVWLLMQRRADEVIAVADEAYQNGSYAQAIDEYNNFIASFENNANVPRAKLRISLSKIRLITETKSNWDKALAMLQEELPSISQLPDFANEGRVELSAILPNIADGLAGMAEKNNDLDLIKHAETALALVEEQVPTSLQPFNQLQSTRRSLELTRRRIARDEEIVTMKTEVTALLDGVKSNASADSEFVRQKLGESYALVTRYLHTHPEMQGDPVIASVKTEIARTEAMCQKWVAEPQNADSSGSAPQEKTPPMPVMLLTGRQSGAAETGAAELSFLCYVKDYLYGLRSTTGEILWRRHIGRLGFDRTSPLIISGIPDNNTLLADDKTLALVMVDASTGSERYRLALDDTFFVNPQPMWPISFVTTKSGKLHLVDLARGKRLGHLDLVQETNAPPCYDHQNRVVVQPARHSALHVLRYDPEAAEPLVNVGIVATGHQPGTIATAPVVHRGHLVVVEQTGPSSSTIKVYGPTVSENPVPWPNEPLQIIPIEGLVKMSPIVSGDDLLYMAERGDVKLITFAASEPGRPYQTLAEGRIDDTLKRGEIISGRYAALTGRSLWVADNRLQRFEIQPSRSRFIPQSTPPTPAMITRSPLVIADRHLLQAYTDPVSGKGVARSVLLENLAVRWQTEFGESVLAEPFVTPNGEALHLVTLTGKLYDIPFDTLTQHGAPPLLNTESYLQRQIAAGMSTDPITHSLRLENGLEVLCSVSAKTDMTSTSTASIFFVCDVNSPQSQIRSHIMPAPLTGPIVPLGQGIVLPLSNGQLAYYSPGDGTIIGNPFVAKRTQNTSPKWSPLTRIRKNRLVGEEIAPLGSAEANQIDINADTERDNDEAVLLVGDADGLLRQIELVVQNNRSTLIATKSVQLPCPIVSQPLVCGRNIIVADNVKHLLLFGYDRLTPEGGRLVPTEEGAASKEQSGAVESVTPPTGAAPVNQSYGGVIITGNVEPTNDSPFVIDTRSARANETPASETSTDQNDTQTPNDAQLDKTAIGGADDKNDAENELPYQAWELAGPVVWGPFSCKAETDSGNKTDEKTQETAHTVIAATDENTFVIVTQADQTAESRKASINEIALDYGLPVGRPIPLSESQMLFVTQKGTLVRFDLEQKSLTPIIETWLRPNCGPTMIQSKIILVSDDGAVYAF